MKLLHRLGIAGAAFAAPVLSFAESIVNIELLNRSILYGLNYDWKFDERWSAGAGLAAVEVQKLSLEENPPQTALVPFFANYDLSPGGDGFFASFGVTLVTNWSEVGGRRPVLGNLKFSAFPLLPGAGFGWEARRESGFVFRAMAHLYVGSTLAPSIGGSFGYAL